MKGLLLLLGLITVNSGAEPPVQAKLESQQLTSPRVGVTILSAEDMPGKITPALPVYLNQTLYFSSHPWDEKRRNQCAGTGIYRLPLPLRTQATRAKEKAELVSLKSPFDKHSADLCLRSLWTDGKTLYAKLADNNSLYYLHNDRELLPLTNPGAQWEGAEQWFWKRDLLSGANQTNLASLEWIMATHQSKRLKGYVVKDKTLFYIDQNLNETDTSFPVFNRIEESVSSPTQLIENEQGDLFALHTSDPNTNKLSRLGFWNVKEAKQPMFWMGSDRPFVRDAPWESRKSALWSARDLRYASATSAGILVADTTTFANEWANIAYYSPRLDGNEFYRVRGLTQSTLVALTGLHYFNQGFFLSHSDTSQIIYFGRNNPFSEDNYPSRKPDLKDLSEQEYQDLIKGEKP